MLHSQKIFSTFFFIIYIYNNWPLVKGYWESSLSCPHLALSWPALSCLCPVLSCQTLAESANDQFGSSCLYPTLLLLLAQISLSFETG